MCNLENQKECTRRSFIINATAVFMGLALGAKITGQQPAAQTFIVEIQNFSRPTIITAPCDEEYPLWHKKIYEDGDYLFVYRDYGKPEYTPNFLIYGKKQKKWIEIKKLSTEHAKLGRSSSSTNNAASPTNWDYSSLKNVNYVGLPLRIAGSINFPDEITYDDNTRTYYLSFNSSVKTKEMLSQFRVLKTDLDQALK